MCIPMEISTLERFAMISAMEKEFWFGHVGNAMRVTLLPMPGEKCSQRPVVIAHGFLFVRTGYGVFEWTSGNRYEGQFLNDKRTGKGSFFWTDGEMYSGEFVADKVCRLPPLFWCLFRSLFYVLQRTGFGVYQYASGDRYRGHFDQGIKQGRGTYNYVNGDVFEGDVRLMYFCWFMCFC